jgi:uncharacterized membrane protein
MRKVEQSRRWVVVFGLLIALAGWSVNTSAWPPPGGGGGGGGGGGTGGTTIRYTLTILNNPFGGDSSHARGMNDWGDVVGEAKAAGTTLAKAYVYTAQAGMVALEELLAPEDRWLRLSNAYDINNHGQVVGAGYVTDTSGVHAYRMNLNFVGGVPVSATIEDLGQLVAGEGTYAVSINDFGDVAGRAFVEAWHVVVWKADAQGNLSPIIDLGTFDGTAGMSTLAESINNDGQIAGTAYGVAWPAAQRPTISIIWEMWWARRPHRGGVTSTGLLSTSERRA